MTEENLKKAIALAQAQDDPIKTQLLLRLAVMVLQDSAQEIDRLADRPVRWTFIVAIFAGLLAIIIYIGLR